MIWPLDRTRYLIALITAGMTYGECAKLMNAKFKANYSRCAIAGKVHRLKRVKVQKPAYVSMMA